MWQLSELIEKHPVVIDHVIVPIRDLHAAAKSRCENLKKAAKYDDPRKVIGGLEGVTDPNEQDIFFLEKFYDFFQFVSTYNIPLTTLQYPRLVLDGEYLYHKINPLISGISKENFLNVFVEAADSSLVHKYTEGDGYDLGYDDSENIKQQSNTTKCVPPAEISQLRPELQQLRSNFLRKEKVLRGVNSKNETLQQQITKLQTEISRKEILIVQKDQAFIDASTVIAEKNQLCTALEEAIAQNTKELNNTNAKIVEKEQQIAIFEDKLICKEQALSDAKDVIVEKHQALAEANSIITKNNDTIAALEEVISQKDNVILEKSRTIGYLKDANTQNETIVAQKGQALEKANADIANLQTIAVEKNLAIANKERQIHAYREELYSVYTSKSWRYTLGMRKVGKLVRRIVSVPHHPWLRAKVKQAYFLLPAFIRNSRLVDNLKNRFKQNESPR